MFITSFSNYASPSLYTVLCSDVGAGASISPDDCILLWQTELKIELEHEQGSSHFSPLHRLGALLS